MAFDGVWHKGEDGYHHPPSIGVFSIVGDRQRMSLADQEQCAIAYLATHREALKALSHDPGVTTFTLALQDRLAPNQGTIAFWRGPSLQRMEYAVDGGIEPVYYGWLDRPNPWEEQQNTEGAAP